MAKCVPVFRYLSDSCTLRIELDSTVSLGVIVDEFRLEIGHDCRYL